MVRQTFYDGVSEFLGFRWEAAGRVALTVRPDLLNGGGLLSGAVAFSMIDYAMGAALWQQIDPETEAIATLNVAINYVATAREGDIVCQAVVDRRNRRAATLTARVETVDDGRLLATSIGSYSIFPRRKET